MQAFAVTPRRCCFAPARRPRATFCALQHCHFLLEVVRSKQRKVGGMSRPTLERMSSIRLHLRRRAAVIAAPRCLRSPDLASRIARSPSFSRRVNGRRCSAVLGGMDQAPASSKGGLGCSDGSEPFTRDPALQAKRHVALFFGYDGRAYRGSEFQTRIDSEVKGANAQGGPLSTTVEEQLVFALYRVGGILDSNYHHENVLKRLKWSRASRTDKVS